MFNLQPMYIFFLVIGVLVFVGGGVWWWSNVVQIETGQDARRDLNVTTSSTTATLIVAGGCFWCVEADLEKLPGVLRATSGYAGGTTQNPTYENYAAGGHREVVEVQYDPVVISFEELIIYTLKHIDVTDSEGSFYDRGHSYSPALYYENETERLVIERVLTELDEFGPFAVPVTVAVEPRPLFWPAEDYHQNYYKSPLTSLKYQYYRTASGRDAFIYKHWGDDTGPRFAWRTKLNMVNQSNEQNLGTKTDNEQGFTLASPEKFWLSYKKPSRETLKIILDDSSYRVTQEADTERAGSSPLNKVYDDGIYVDILSGEPLFSSRDKFDSGTGWPSFVAPITATAVTEYEDHSFFSVRTEVRSAVADNHLGHVFLDGPSDRGGVRYCINGVALRFVPKAEMEATGYGEFLQAL